MICEECKKRPANVHLTRIVGNNKVELHLCEDCAKEKGEFSEILNPGFTIQQLLSGLLQGDIAPSPPEMAAQSPVRCESCGMTYRDFVNMGRLGCDRCYTTFSERLSPLLRRIHGGNRHVGKVPLRTGGVARLKKDIDDLRDELKSLIAQEKYEEAAKVRDAIREMEKQLPTQ